MAKIIPPQSTSLNHNQSARLKFTKSQRLLDAESYSRVFGDAPYRASSPHFLILARDSDHSSARLGLIVAKKNVNKANQRNRIKRLIRESFRLQQHNIIPIDAIVLARKGAGELSNKDITTTINKLWKRVLQRANAQTKKTSEK